MTPDSSLSPHPNIGPGLEWMPGDVNQLCVCVCVKCTYKDTFFSHTLSLTSLCLPSPEIPTSERLGPSCVHPDGLPHPEHGAQELRHHLHGSGGPQR